MIKRYFARRAYAAAHSKYRATPHPGERLNWWQRHYRHHQFFRHYMQQAARLQKLGCNV